MKQSSPQPAPARYFATVPPQEILPITDANFRSSVPGIYVIGDVTGLPLVKVAANQGVEVIERLTKTVPRAAGPRAAEMLDLVIVGGGPAGLAAAVEAQRRGWRCAVLERTRIASTVHAFPPGKRVYSEPRFLRNRSALPAEGDPPKDVFLRGVADVVEKEALDVREGVEVVDVRADGNAGFTVATAGGESLSTRFVILAVGRQGQPRTLGVPGEGLEARVTHRFHTAADYRNQRVLVVGGGNSAVEAALMLADHNRVTVAYRRDAFFRLKANNLTAVTEAAAAGRLEVLFNSTVTEIRADEVELDVAGTRRVLPNDTVMILAGTLPPIDFLRRLGLELDGIWTRKRVIGAVLGVVAGCLVYFGAKHLALLPAAAGPGVVYVPGFSWLYRFVPPFFGNLYGLYYLLYFCAIAVCGIYWAVKMRHRLVWRRNMLNILFNWTLWWGAPTLLAARYGRNVWTSVLPKLVNAWPLNMGAWDISPVVRAGEPAWWHVAAVCGVVWAVCLTFIVLPLFTVLVGKHYCSHLCSCGALAETVGNGFRHRGPKTDRARRWERFGFCFIALAAAATVAHVLGKDMPLTLYNTWAGTLLAGALAIGLYPFLGQRIWCRYWCPLAFWMNFWGRWSRFRISPEPGKCIDCNVCNQYCQMGIDIKSRALRGAPVTLRDTPCVACGECVVRCPMEILHFGKLPAGKPYADGTDAGDATVSLSLRHADDMAQLNEMSARDRERNA